MAGVGAGGGSERLTQEVESKYKKWQKKKKKITMRKEHLYVQSRAPGNFGKDNEEGDSTH